MSRSYFLSAAELAGTRVKVERVNARARRRGFTGSFELEAVPAERKIRTTAGTDRTVCGFEVTLTGSAPSYEGWSFVAAVDAAPAGAVIRSAPSVPEISPASITPGVCDHCGTSRARKHTYLVRSEVTGEIVQVGKTCMKDFLGWDVFPVFIDEESVEDDLFGGFGGLGGRVFDAPLVDVARLAFAAVDVFGYHGRFSKLSTSQVVAAILDETKGSEELREQLAEALLDDDVVSDRLEIVRGTLTADAGFEANLRTILAGDVVQRVHLGLAATVGLIYQRAVSRAVQEEHEAPEHVSEWIGVEGKRIAVEGTVIQAMTIDGTFGSSRLVVVSVGQGDRVKMFTAAGWAWDVDAGEAVTLTGTVKAHEEYHQRRETLLTRPKRVSHE